MELKLINVLITTVVMFAIGGLFYMGIFGKQWGEIFGFEKLSKKEQDAERKKMGPFMLLQFAMTILTALALNKFIVLLPDESVWMIGLWIWIGFLIPANVSGVIFGGTAKKWWSRQLGIMISESFVRIMVSVWIISLL